MNGHDLPGARGTSEGLLPAAQEDGGVRIVARLASAR